LRGLSGLRDGAVAALHDSPECLANTTAFLKGLMHNNYKFGRLSGETFKSNNAL